MPAFDIFCPVHATPPQKLVALARLYHPIIPKPNSGLPIETLAHILDQRDIASESYLWAKPRPVSVIGSWNAQGGLISHAGLRAVATLITAHRCDIQHVSLARETPPPFKPRAAEVLLQIKDKAADSLRRGIAVCTYETIFPAFDWRTYPRRHNFSLLHEEKGRVQFLSLKGKRVIHDGDEIVQLALTTLYASNGGKAYPEVSSRPIKCRNIIYPPETGNTAASAKLFQALTYA